MPAESFDDFVARLTAAGCDPQEGPGGQWGALCPLPAHGDDGDGRASLSFRRGDTQPVVATCHAGCSFAEIQRILRVGESGMPGRLARGDTASKRRGRPSGRVVTTYPYVDKDGNELFQMVRFDPKDFRPRRWVGLRWLWHLDDDVYRPLYRLPEILAAGLDDPIFLVEGEKDADALAALGLVATTNAFGVKGWDPKKFPDYVRTLAGRHVAVVPDNDRAGRDGARARAESLAGVAESVRIVELPGLDAHGDVSDWLGTGGTAEALLAMLDETPEGTTTAGITSALDELAGRDPAEVIRWALADGEVIAELARADEAEVELALLGLRDRGARAIETDALKRAISARRRETKRVEREAALEEAAKAEVSIEALLRDVAGKWDQESERLHDLSSLLNEIVVFLRRYVWFPRRSQAHAVALWVAHTYLTQAAYTSPRLSIRGPSMECGKTRLLECLDVLVFLPINTVNITTPVLFRLIGERPRTVLLDEIDTIFGPKAKGNEELRGLIDAGQRRGGKVYRLTGDTAHGYDAEEFPVFGPVALTGIGRLPGTIESRSIIIELARKRDRNRVSRFRAEKVERIASVLRSRLAAWALHHVDELKEATPDLPDELSDRAQDGWEPLLAIADAAGGAWPKRARMAALALRPTRTVDDSDPMLLLADVRRVFHERGWPDALPTLDLLSDLRAIEESPWGTYRKGEGLSTHGLAKLLGAFGVKPVHVWAGPRQCRGYRQADLRDPWDRYLDPLKKTTQRGQEEGPEGTHKEKPAPQGESKCKSVPTAGQRPEKSVRDESAWDGSKGPLTRTWDGCTDQSVPRAGVNGNGAQGGHVEQSSADDGTEL